MLTSIFRLVNGWKQRIEEKHIANDNKIVHNLNDKSFVRYRYKQKQNLWANWKQL